MLRNRGRIDLIPGGAHVREEEFWPSLNRLASRKFYLQGMCACDRFTLSACFEHSRHCLYNATHTRARALSLQFHNICLSGHPRTCVRQTVLKTGKYQVACVSIGTTARRMIVLASWRRNLSIRRTCGKSARADLQLGVRLNTQWPHTVTCGPPPCSMNYGAKIGERTIPQIRRQ